MFHTIKTKAHQAVLANPDVNVATARTTTNTAFIGAVAYLIQRFTGTTIDTTDPLILIGVPVVVGIGYRASRAVTNRWPVFGTVLFGYDETPTYG